MNSSKDYISVSQVVPCGLKLDICKAFDSLYWGFLFKSLHYFGSNDNWIHLVEECICGSRGCVLINGEASGFFPMNCGLRQGDPLSPYLFILAEETLILNISNLISKGDLIPLFRSSVTRPCHLLFAEDILLFFKVIPQ